MVSIVKPVGGAQAYAFSYDRESFAGDYATRELAADAGFRGAASRRMRVDAVYVGKRVPVDPQADRHAEGVVRSMRQRFATSIGDREYLSHVNEHLLADLDAAIARAIEAWLARHGLAPASRLSSISEHSLPAVRAHGPARDDEVHLIGPEE